MSIKNKAAEDGIAVVGASALFPGSNGGLSFWNNILDGRDFMTDVPADHWLIDDYYDADPMKAGKVYSKRGAFLPKVDFDPMLHGIPPKQLSTTDTAQLLAIIVANKVLADAASVQFGKVSKKDISVILGIASATELVGQMVAKIQRPHWTKALRDSGLPESEVQSICDRIEATYPTWDESTFPGLLGNVVAGRVANRLDLGGTNCVVDAACASSLGAVSMAIQELRAGYSDLVITGGADALNDIFMYMCFSKTPALSPTGDCRPFSDNADGTMLGEGIGMVALRRLADAERDGDKIYAVIRGMGSSSDGRAKSIYAPRAEGQEIAIRRAYERAGYGAQEVELIEAHGTGTKAGDAAEFGGLRRAFTGVDRNDRQWCALGSVKSQIGHTKAAAGSASLFKIVMALHHKVYPPTLKVDKPNSKMDIENSPFYLNTQTRPWIHSPETTRKGSVSAFGFGGSNFHMTLEEYAGEKSTARRYSNLPVHLLLVHGANADVLIAKANEANGELATASLPYAARNSQLAFDPKATHRLAIIAPDAQTATASLDAALKMISKDKDASFSLPNRMHYSVGAETPKIAFLFPGQGSQYVNMGSALAVEFDAARKVWDETAAMNLDAERKLHQVVFPIPVFSDAERDVQNELLTRTHWAQPAIGATSLSMLRLLGVLGVNADAAAGHSYGEVTALFAAGAITTPESLLAISRKRGELMNEAAATPGSMMAVMTSVQRVRQLIDEANAAGVTVANINSPNQVVVAGKTQSIEQFESALKAAQITFRRLPVATAFHTELVAGCAEPFGKFLAETPISTPAMSVYANSTGTPYKTAPDEIRATLAWQLANPVRFEEMIGRMHQDGIRLFLEVGPGSVLTAMVDDCLVQKPHVAVSLDGRKADGRAALLNALGVLSANGIAVDYAALWEEFVPFDAPQDAPKLSAASVKLSGSNYGKPYPPVEGSVAVPKPNPERAVAALQPVKQVQSQHAPVAPMTSVTHAPPATIAPPQPQQVQPMSVPRPAMDANWSAAFQIMQQQTLEAQKAFTQTLSESHQAFLRVSETAFSQLGQLAGAQTFQAPLASSIPAPVPFVQPIVAPPVSVPAAKAAPIAAPPVAFAAPVPAVAAVVPAIDFEGLLMAVVSDKTGYPIEMLTLDMELESGLGIDSIKRVEILSVLQEKIPALADVDPSKLAALNTLGEIVDFAKKTAPATASVAAAPVKAAAPAAGPAIDFEGLLMAVVSDKTGYPIEMLTLDMELESGLGIDSIKRVEILSVLQEKIPALADVDPSKLASLNTLGEIVAFASMTAPATAAVTAHPAKVSAAAEAVSAIDFEGLLMAIVADKTGYPIEMLTLDMELESGLGIDSIKRVEILSVLQEKIPSLADVDPSKLASLNTLGEIVAFAASTAPSTPSTPSTTAVTVAPVADFEGLLMAVVADKTGYPIEMLTLDMELESGLGIDSIKRVEILSVLQEKIPSLADVDPAKLSVLNTLGEIVDFSRGVAAQGEATVSQPSAKIAEKKGADLRRLVIGVSEIPATGLATPGITSADPLYLVSDNRGVAPLLATKLAAAGIRAVVVAAPPADAAAVAILSGLDNVADTAKDQAGKNETVFRHLQACANTMASRGVLLVTVQDTGGDFGLTGAVGNRAWSAGIVAAAKTAALEWPQASVKAIDVETGGREPEAIASVLFNELIAGGAGLEVGLKADGRRVSPAAVEESITPRTASKFTADDVIVVSGGARGVTAACLTELLGRTRVKVAILGRTALNEEAAGLAGLSTDAELKKALLQRYKESGKAITPQQLGAEVRGIIEQRELRGNLKKFAALATSVQYFPVDVGSGDAVAAAVNTIRKDIGPIRGLVHAAGVLADKEIKLKTLEQFQMVLRTKLDGFRHLLDATRKDNITQIVCFSSVAARVGNVGQIDYAMANEVLNRVCREEQTRRGAGCLVKAIGWGPWAGGMVDPGLEKHFAAMGVALIPLAQGAKLFADEYTGINGDASEIVYGGGLEHFGGAVGGHANGRTSHVWIHAGTHPYLMSHVIRSVPVVPLVEANNIALHAVSALYPGAKVLTTHNLQVVKGMQLQHFSTTGDWYAVECSPDEANDRVRVRIVDAAGVVYYSLDVLLGAPHNGSGLAPRSADLSLAPWNLKVDEIYDGPLFHGPDLQVIESLQGISDQGCVATLRSRSPLMQGSSLNVDVLDGGLQLALLWVHDRMGRQSLPTELGRYQIHGAWKHGESIRCELQCEARSSLMTKWNIRYSDAAGRLLASIEGLKIHLLPEAAPGQSKAAELLGAEIV